MHQITLEQATTDIASILQDVANGEEIMVMDHDTPFVKMTPAANWEVARPAPTRSLFGFAKGFVTYIADDFDAPLEEFKDYL